MSKTIVLSLADASLRASIVALLVGAILAAARPLSPAVRHMAWALVTCAMLMMPLVTSLVPGIAPPFALPITLERESANDRLQGALPRREPEDHGVASAFPTRSSAPASTTLRSAEAPEADVRWFLWFPQADPMATLLGVYALGVTLGLLRLAIGWSGAIQLARAAWVVSAGAVESSRVCTPLVAGVFAPVIVLPIEWRGWPSDTVRAVMVHERAHVTRRDPLVQFVASVNRCVFWFHPLAWWLRRTLSVAAECASDDAAVNAGVDRRWYAELLVTMADTVRANRRRFNASGIGIDGRGPLDCRVLRLLNEPPTDRISPMRTRVALITAVAVVVIVGGCRQPVSSVSREIAEYEASATDDPQAMVALARAVLTLRGRGMSPADRGRELEQQAKRYRLAQKYFERAVQIAPDYATAHRLLLEVRYRLRNPFPPLQPTPLDARYKTVTALPDGQRFDRMTDDVLSLFNGVDDVSRRWDDVAVNEYVDLSMRLSDAFAHDLLTLAPKLANHARHGTGIFRAHMVLAGLAYRNGDHAAALQHITAASHAPLSEELKYGRGIAAWRVLSDLVAAGEREPVATFLDRMSEVNVVDRSELRGLALAVRSGETPKFPHWTMAL